MLTLTQGDFAWLCALAAQLKGAPDTSMRESERQPGLDLGVRHAIAIGHLSGTVRALGGQLERLLSAVERRAEPDEDTTTEDA